MEPKYEIEKSTNDKYYFNLKAGNGEKILTSQMYITKAGANTGIESVRQNALLDERYDRKTASGDQPHYFVLKAANHEIIGKSETYTSTSAMEKGIDSVKKNAPDAKVEDLT